MCKLTRFDKPTASRSQQELITLAMGFMIEHSEKFTLTSTEIEYLDFMKIEFNSFAKIYAKNVLSLVDTVFDKLKLITNDEDLECDAFSLSIAFGSELYGNQNFWGGSKKLKLDRLFPILMKKMFENKKAYIIDNSLKVVDMLHKYNRGDDYTKSFYKLKKSGEIN